MNNEKFKRKYIKLIEIISSMTIDELEQLAADGYSEGGDAGYAKYHLANMAIKEFGK